MAFQLSTTVIRCSYHEKTKLMCKTIFPNWDPELTDIDNESEHEEGPYLKGICSSNIEIVKTFQRKFLDATEDPENKSIELRRDLQNWDLKEDDCLVCRKSLNTIDIDEKTKEPRLVKKTGKTKVMESHNYFVKLQHYTSKTHLESLITLAAQYHYNISPALYDNMLRFVEAECTEEKERMRAMQHRLMLEENSKRKKLSMAKRSKELNEKASKATDMTESDAMELNKKYKLDTEKHHEVTHHYHGLGNTAELLRKKELQAQKLASQQRRRELIETAVSRNETLDLESFNDHVFEAEEIEYQTEDETPISIYPLYDDYDLENMDAPEYAPEQSQTNYDIEHMNEAAFYPENIPVSDETEFNPINDEEHPPLEDSPETL